MIPEGRERDTRIAELKGYIWHDIPADADGENAGRVLAPPDFKDSGWVPPPKGRVSPLIFVPNYSTAITHALGLFGEMSITHGIRLYTNKYAVSKKEFYVVYIEIPGNGLESGVDALSNKFSNINQAMADAISKVYLRWTEFLK